MTRQMLTGIAAFCATMLFLAQQAHIIAA